MRRLPAFATALAVAALLLGALPPPAAAGPEPPSPVATAYNTQRKIVASPDGTLYAAVSLEVGGTPTVRVLEKPPGGAWTQLPPPTTTGNASDRASLAIDSGGRLHLAWTEVTPADRQVFYSRYENGAWTPAFQISHSPGYAGFPAVAVDGRDRVHVAWYALSNQTASIYQIFYRRLDAGGWSPERALTSTSLDATNPALAVGPDGTVHIVWARETPRLDTEIAYLRISGDSAAPAVVLSPALVPAIAPSLVVAPDNTLHVVWSAGGGLQYREWNRTWLPVQTITNGTPEVRNASLTLDPVGRLHVFWDSSDGAIYHQVLNGTWSVPVAAVTGGRNFDPSTRWSLYDNPLCGPAAGIDLMWTRDNGTALSLEYLRVDVPGPACPPPAARAPVLTPLLALGVGAASLAAAGVFLLLSRRWRARPRRPR